MSGSPALLSGLPQLVCDQVDVILPDLKKCAPHEGKFNLEELKKSGVASPAVLISVLGAKQGRSLAGHSIEFPLSMAAYVIAKDGLGAPRDVRAMNICQALLSLIPEQNWGEAALGRAHNVNLHSLITGKSRDVTVSLWAVTWTQPVTFFSSLDLPLGVELYVDDAQLGGQTS